MPVTTRNMAQQQQPNQSAQEVVEPYKLNEIFSIVREYDGNQINLNTFLSSCKTAYDMAIGNQKLLLTVHVKNKLKGRAAEIVNSRNPTTWDEIKILLESHFGDSRDLTSLIQDLQRIRQLPSESPLTFIARLQTHEAKMHASIHKQQLTGAQKQLTDAMVLNTLLTGLEPKIGHVVRASNPGDMLTAIVRVRRELQLNYFENQKFNRNNANIPARKPNTPLPVK
uniref:Retrotransposon gag domain-containing protein n=1 Tax=Anoplophora glabripennis TaxID=217634 RepID=V5FZK3_ANOGL